MLALLKFEDLCLLVVEICLEMFKSAVTVWSLYDDDVAREGSAL